MWAEARRRMVETQIQARGVRDPRVLEALLRVPRHVYVPDTDPPAAYEDHPLPIGAGQTISQPYMVAWMTELLRLAGPERVLEIGTGSGYQTAVLAELADTVFSVERLADVADRAGRRLADQGYRNVRLRTGDGSRGWPEEAPFDRIMVTAAAPEIPRPLFDQLGEGGRMVLPVGSGFAQELLLVTREAGRAISRSQGGCIFVKLYGDHGYPPGPAGDHATPL